MADKEIINATVKNCVFFQNESARAYAAAAWELENGAVSRTAAAQERAAIYAFEARTRLFQLIGAE